MSLLVLALTLALTLAAALGRPPLVLSVLVGTALLMPLTLVVPQSPTAVLTCSRLITIGAVVGVVRARRRDPSAPGLRMPMALLLLLAFLVTCAIAGVGLADGQTDPVPAAYSWVAQAEQAVFLVLALELGRRVGARRVLATLTIGVAAAALIGIGEGLTHTSYAHALFTANPGQDGGVAAGQLEQRSGGLRVRGAADFALAYGWVLTALFPSVAMLMSSLRNRLSGISAVLPLLVLPAVIGAVVLTRSRSPLVGLVVVAVVLLGVLAPRRTSGRLLLLVAAVVGAGLAAPALLKVVSPSVDNGSIDVRVQRLPDVLELAAKRPLQGAGLTSIGRLGLGGVDSSYVLTYVECGLIAVVLLVAALLAAVVTVARAVPGVRDDDQRLVLAAVLGMVSFIAGAVTYDAFTVLMSEHTFWLLCGLGAAAAERRCGPEALPDARRVFSVGTALLVGLAVGVGLVLRLVVPAHTETEVVFSTMSPAVENRDDPHGLARTLVTTTCQVAREVAQQGKPWSVSSCSEINLPGWGRLRIVGPAPDVTLQAAQQVYSAARSVPGLDDVRFGATAASPAQGLPTAVRTSPEMLGLGTALVLLMVLRRREDEPVADVAVEPRDAPDELPPAPRPLARLRTPDGP